MKVSYIIKRQAYINIFNILFLLLFIFQIIKSQNSECGKNEPFFKSNGCTSEPCSKEEFNSKDCIISNKIIKTQWLNNIILIGGSGFRYLYFASYSNGDMIIGITSNPIQPERIFFGLTTEGKPLFKENEEEKFFYSINITDASYMQYEGEGFIIKSSNGENYGKEYFFGISKVGCNAELFDFTNNKVYVKSSRSFTGLEFLYSNRNGFLSLESVSSDYTYLYSFVAGHIDEGNRVHFQIHKFNSINGFKEANTLVKEISVQKAYGNMVSCYLSSKGLIYCFYMYSEFNKIYFRLDKYEKDLTGNKYLSFESNLYDSEQRNFYKCINFKDEVSVLAFYGDFNSIFYPIFLFRNFNVTNQNFEDYIPGNPYYSGMYLSKKEFSFQLGFNDIIKINENKLAFSCITKDKETIYIIIISMFNNKKLKARYYSIDSFKLYNLKVLLELKIQKYNSFIAFAASFCSQQKCENDEDEHFSSLIIFSYPNGTDYAMDLEKYLYDNNDIKIDRIGINLTNQVNIDNNIFGHIFYRILIQKMQLSENYEIYSSKDKSKKIREYTFLEENETIILEPQRNGIKFPSLLFSIEYYFKTKEPQFELFESYTVEKEGDDDQQFFNQDEYQGKLNYFKIQSNFELTDKCDNANCELCFYSQRDICITCKYNFTPTEINQQLSKICQDEEKTDIVTEKFTDQITPTITDEISTEIIVDKTNEKTDEITYAPTNKFTEKITNIITDKVITEKITDEITNIKTTEQITDEITNIKSTEQITDEITKLKSTEQITDEITNLKTTDKITEETTNLKITDKITDEITNLKSTDKITDETTNLKITDKITNIVTDKAITNKLTDEITEKISKEITEGINENKITENIINKITDRITIGVVTENMIKETDKINQNTINAITHKVTEQTSDEIKYENKTKSCLNEELLKNKYCNGTITEKQIGEIHDDIKNKYVNKEHKGNNTIIKTDNVIFQVSTHEDQKNSDNTDVSSIDLGICEETLKSKNKIPKEESLIILKTDVKSEDLSQTYVYYEVYNPITLQILNITDCENDTISINTPVNLDEVTSILYSSLKDFGYNLFNSSDDFYNDICSKYTSVNGTDISMADRKNIIFNNNGKMSLCQKRCSFENYNTKTRKVKCNCSPQTSNKFMESFDILFEDFSMNSLGDNFFNTLKHSNILVLRCYKLAIELQNFFANYGRIFMLIVVILSIFSLFYFYLKESKNIDKYITAVSNEKLRYTKNKNHQKEINQNKKNAKNRKKTSIIKIQSKSPFKGSNKSPSKKKLILDIKEKKSRHKNSFHVKKSNMVNKFSKVKSKVKNFKTQGDQKDFAPPKKLKNNHTKLNSSKNNDNNNINSKCFLKEDSHNKILNKSKSPNRNKNSINIIKIKNVNFGIINNKNKNSKSKDKNINKNVNNNKIKKNLSFNKNKLGSIYGDNHKIRKDTYSKTSKLSSNKQVKKKLEFKPIKNEIINKNLTDQELNNLNYEKALIIDKRTFFQYYFSLLRTKHIILFTFCQPNDYNLFSIKLCLFLLSFSLYLSINCFFFDDNTMHSIYIENGNYNFILQLPQIILSSLISIIINIFLKELSLTEKSILSFKGIKNLENIQQKSSKLINYLKMKILIFFIICLLLLFFFLYFISCFCAVYPNTQIILFKDTCFSFLVSLVYPFAIYFFPPTFRIPALRAKKKDKNVIYKIGNILALL